MIQLKLCTRTARMVDFGWRLLKLRHRGRFGSSHLQQGEVQPLDGAALLKVEKPATVRELGGVDVQALRARVERLSEKAWNLDDARKENDFFCFEHTRHIIFRFIHRN